MSREEKVLKVGSRVITFLTTLITFTTVFVIIYKYGISDTGIIALLLMAGLLGTLLFNYILGSLWFIIVYAVIILSNDFRKDDDFLDFNL